MNCFQCHFSKKNYTITDCEFLMVVPLGVTDNVALKPRVKVAPRNFRSS